MMAQRLAGEIGSSAEDPGMTSVSATRGAEAPWKQRFRVERILWSTLAEEPPDRGLAVSNRTGRYQLYAWDVPTGQLRQLTDRPEGVVFGFIDSLGRHVYYLDDTGGNEIGHLVRVPFAGGHVEDTSPGLPPYSTFGGVISATGNRLAFTRADAEGFTLTLVDLGADGEMSEPRTLFRSKRVVSPPSLSPQGDLAVVASAERSTMQHYTLLAFDARTGERVAELWDGEGTSVEGGPFARRMTANGEARLAGTSNRSGFVRPLIWYPRTGERHDLRVDDLSGDVAPLDWSHDGDRLLLLQTDRAQHRLWIYDVAGDATHELDHPPGYFGFTYFGPEGEIFAAWEDAAHPTRVIALDPDTGSLHRTVLAAGETVPSRPLRAVTFDSTDGQEIQGWLGVPQGQGPFPTILYTHGGPESFQTNEFSPEAQAWLDQGFAWLSINFRGSTTFGRAFQQQIWGNLGHWELEDMVAARDWLVREGIAHPDQIFLSGWSYGGYLTLLALGRRPELWAGGMAGVAIADWAMLYEDSSETLRGYCSAMFGRTPGDKCEQYAASSPMADVERVQAPLLIIQGRNDSRTPARPVEVYVERLRALGKSVEVEWFDAGHLGGFADSDLGIAHQERMLRFAQHVLDQNSA
jgi:dipeptidyl aminopeptidase/acylaminoacyl peptidase